MVYASIEPTPESGYDVLLWFTFNLHVNLHVCAMIKSGGPEQAMQAVDSCFKLVGSRQHHVHVHVHVHAHVHTCTRL